MTNKKNAHQPKPMSTIIAGDIVKQLAARHQYCAPVRAKLTLIEARERKCLTSADLRRISDFVIDHAETGWTMRDVRESHLVNDQFSLNRTIRELMEKLCPDVTLKCDRNQRINGRLESYCYFVDVVQESRQNTLF